MSSSSTQRITASGTAARSRRGLGGLERFRRHIDMLGSPQGSMRQEDLKAGDVPAGSAKTLEGNSAPVFLNDAFADPQSETGALCRLGGEERLEEVPGVFGIDANAGVADGDPCAGVPV